MNESGFISTSAIVVPDSVQRNFIKVDDDRDRASIKAHGIQQPLVVVLDGKRLLLVNGLRRLRLAKDLGLAKVPYVLAHVPRGQKPESYIVELRLALHTHQEELSPSQKCAWVVHLKEAFGLTNRLVATYLGIASDSVTNWLSVKTYLPPIVSALDAGALSMSAARVFDGLTEKGQQAIWKRHGEELLGEGQGSQHKRLRHLYPPSKHPDYYRNAKLVETRLARKSGKRRGKIANVPAQEKRRLLSSVELRDIELREGTVDEKRKKAQIIASIPLIYGIMRSEDLKVKAGKAVPGCIEEFERVMEIY